MIVHDSYLGKDFKKHEPSDICVGKSFQMDDYGNFRLVVNGKEGEWVPYRSIATVDVEVDGITEKYIGISAYFGGSGIPIEKVLKIEVLKIEETEE